jgi:hypothetical protein
MIRIGGLLAALAALAIAGAAAPAVALSVDFSFQPVTVIEASPNNYTFSEGGFTGGASITGSFAGVDTNGDGQLSYFTNPGVPGLPLEVTDFTLNFSGNALVPAFSLTFPQLDNFNYQFGSTLGVNADPSSILGEGIEAGSTDRFYIAGPGPLIAEGIDAPPGLCAGTQPCGGVLALPEPSAWALLIVGIGLTGAVMRRRDAFAGSAGRRYPRPTSR